MSAANPSEFSLPNRYAYDLRTPVRWIVSHVLRYWIFLVLVVVAAILNAVGAFLIPLLVGQAFNNFLGPERDIQVIGNLALLMALSQVARAGVLLLRNASSETLAQRMERDVREELYTSLLGKSMTFHSMQSVVDIMARATNDVR
ncbi:MAG: ABC transporter ATP-binding protein, partial [Anaerolineae bacterium]|nr:ABC transporter ATP-binding protein [Anaerolineae bacterium]